MHIAKNHWKWNQMACAFLQHPNHWNSKRWQNLRVPKSSLPFLQLKKKIKNKRVLLPYITSVLLMSLPRKKQPLSYWSWLNFKDTEKLIGWNEASKEKLCVKSSSTKDLHAIQGATIWSSSSILNVVEECIMLGRKFSFALFPPKCVLLFLFPCPTFNLKVYKIRNVKKVNEGNMEH